jgi:hypothetical protein
MSFGMSPAASLELQFVKTNRPLVGGQGSRPAPPSLMPILQRRLEAAGWLRHLAQTPFGSMSFARIKLKTPKTYPIKTFRRVLAYHSPYARRMEDKCILLIISGLKNAHPIHWRLD